MLRVFQYLLIIAGLMVTGSVSAHEKCKVGFSSGVVVKLPDPVTGELLDPYKMGMEKIFAALPQELEWVDHDSWRNLYMEFNDGKLDLLPTTVLTKNRQKKAHEFSVSWIDIPVFTFYKKNGKTIPNTWLQDGLKVGVISSVMYEVEAIARMLDIRVRLFESNTIAHAVALLENDVIDMLIGTANYFEVLDEVSTTFAVEARQTSKVTVGSRIWVHENQGCGLDMLALNKAIKEFRGSAEADFVHQAATRSFSLKAQEAILIAR